MTAKDIRNICLLGHGGNGKTSLTESMLFLTGASDRLGRVADGNTVCDYDQEEIKRKISISLSVAPVSYKDFKINVLDTPGYFDFSGEALEALRVADAGVIVCSAKEGVTVGAEKAWRYLQERNMPRAIYISKIDEDGADFNGALEALRAKFGISVCPVIIPMWGENKKVSALLDIPAKKAYQINDKGQRVEIPIPADKTDVVEEFYQQLCESVAETSEEKMEKFFGGEPFTESEVFEGLHDGVKLFPNPLEIPNRKGRDIEGNPVEVELREDGQPYAFVFKTTSDQYGKYSYFKVITGKVAQDMTMLNSRTGNTEKLGRLYIMKGKKGEEVKEICCGDIGAIGKMDDKTGDTLCDPKHIVRLHGMDYAQPCYSRPSPPRPSRRTRSWAPASNKLNEEDPTFHVVNNAETHQTVISGAGDIQIDVLCFQAQDAASAWSRAVRSPRGLPREDPQDRPQAGPL
jgi:elongation factor G